MPRIFALWELESDPNYLNYLAGGLGLEVFRQPARLPLKLRFYELSVTYNDEGLHSRGSMRFWDMGDSVVVAVTL